MTALAAELARHVDPAGNDHRLLLIAPGKLRCVVCARTIDLRPALAAVPGATSTSRGLPHADQSCPKHPGEWPGRCGPCRAEQLERCGDPLPFTPTADVASGVAAARRALERTS